MTDASNPIATVPERQCPKCGSGDTALAYCEWLSATPLLGLRRQPRR